MRFTCHTGKCYPVVCTINVGSESSGSSPQLTVAHRMSLGLWHLTPVVPPGRRKLLAPGRASLAGLNFPRLGGCFRGPSLRKFLFSNLIPLRSSFITCEHMWRLVAGYLAKEVEIGSDLLRASGRILPRSSNTSEEYKPRGGDVSL